MTTSSRRIRTPVKREGAERYLLLSLVSFAASVILTRLFLQMTGYPQIGNSELHIAHVLWGGLILFIASLLPLLLANRWVMNTAAILSGVGVGLFIDEVGKFITQSNDYFYPPAAPIIYAFFLLTVLLYLQIKRPPDPTPRSEMYGIFDDMSEVLDCDLDSQERSSMETRLKQVESQTDDPNLKRLIPALIDFLQEEKIQVVPKIPSYLQRAQLHIGPYHEKIVTRRNLKWFLILALGAMGVISLIEFVVLLASIPAPGSAIERMITPLVTRGELHSAQDALWFMVRILLEGVTGLMLVISGGLFTMGKEPQATRIATLTLIMWITAINLLVFYLDQFGAVTTTLIQFFVLMLLLYYRRRYLSL